MIDTFFREDYSGKKSFQTEKISLDLEEMEIQ